MESETDETLWSAFSDFLPKETCIGQRLKEFTAPNGCNHFFVNSKTALLAQASYIGRRIEHLLYRYHSPFALENKPPGEIWLHGVGSAIQITIELALHLQLRMYPGHLKTEVKTSSCTTTKEILSLTNLQHAVIKERDAPKSAVHVKLQLIPTLENQ
ncbi:hypothetical protein FGIG_05676 [Fasciola gigantica]|uniref:Uncharacterized protein n=1 Tax=Fasciola gigantica TaxID=46835 RepID=A0A504YH43_FASGI|nr:hypothetical protein FGIG_05676 [Fasciola gigantica]